LSSLPTNPSRRAAQTTNVSQERLNLAADPIDLSTVSAVEHAHQQSRQQLWRDVELVIS
jgi:hypothetical protein